MHSPHLLLCLTLCASPLAAQRADRGVFAIQRGETALGREEFSIQPGTDGRTGSTLASLVRYPATAPTVQIQGMLEQDANGAVVALQIDTRQQAGLTRVYGAALRDNLTIRQTTSTAESVRQYPRSGGIVILDDSVFAFYQAVAERATTGGTRLQVLFARAGRRGQVTATATTPTTIDLTGAVTGTLTVDASGRLMGVSLANGLSALRQSR